MPKYENLSKSMYSVNIFHVKYARYLGADLYKRLQQFVLTEDQLKENNFPRPDPVQGGTAIFYGEQKTSQKGSTKGIFIQRYMYCFPRLI